MNVSIYRPASVTWASCHDNWNCMQGFFGYASCGETSVTPRHYCCHKGPEEGSGSEINSVMNEVAPGGSFLQTRLPHPSYRRSFIVFFLNLHPHPHTCPKRHPMHKVIQHNLLLDHHNAVAILFPFLLRRNNHGHCGARGHPRMSGH